MEPSRMKSEQTVGFGDSNMQDAMGSALESYSPPGSGFELFPPEASPPDGRRRRRDIPSRSEYTYTPYLDGHLWRKYGQKKIKDAEHPRLYYRCSYRDDRRCLASMLLQQQSGEDPPLYHVTYTYQHTCGAPPVPMPDIMVEQQRPTATARKQGFVLRFDSPGGHGHHNDMQHHQAMSSRSSYTMLSFGSSNQQPVFRSDPGAGSSSSSSFPTEALPALSTSSMNGDGDMYPAWNSLAYDLEDRMRFGDHEHFHYNSTDDYYELIKQCVPSP